MASIRSDTVYTKTAKGLLELNRKPATLPLALSAVFLSVDGKATVTDLRARCGLGHEELDHALETLLSDGYIENAAERAQQAFGFAADPNLDFRPEQATPLPPLDPAERVRELTARAEAEHRARGRSNERLPAIDLPDSTDDTTAEPARAAEPSSRDEPPKLDLDGVDVDASPTPGYVPTALERAMARLAAKTGEQPAGAHAASASAKAQQTPAKSVAEAKIDAPFAQPPLQDMPGRAELPRRDLLDEPAEAQRKAEAAQLARDAERAHRRRVETEAQRRAQLARGSHRKRLLWTLVIVLIGVPAAALLVLQYVPLSGYAPAVERTLSERLGEPVAIGSVRYVLVPTPRLVIDDVALPRRPAVRIDRLEAPMAPWTALSGPSHVEVVDAHGLRIDGATLGAIPAWSGNRGEGAIQVDRLRLNGVKLDLPQAELAAVDGDIAFAADGAVKSAVFTNPNAKLELTSQAEGMRLLLNARDWRMPYGPPVEFSELLVTGTVEPRKRAAGEFTGRMAGGTVEGAFSANWSGAVALDGKFKVQHARIEDIAAESKSNVAARGSTQASGRFSMKAADWAGLRASSRIDGTFAIVRGELTNIDLVRAIQSPTTASLRGGRTPFDRLSGVLQSANGHYTYRDLELVSGPLNASGSVSVAPDGRLGGRVNVELASRGGVVGRSVLNLAGTVKDPRLKR
jgi:hypothetical protein